MPSRPLFALAAAAVLVAGVWVTATPSGAVPMPSPTPTATATGAGGWSTIAPVPSTSDDAAVAALVAQLTAAQAALTAAGQAAEQAEQKAALAHQQLQATQAAAARAHSDLAAAKAELDDATTTLRQVAVADYMGGTTSSLSVLLSVTDPARVAEAVAAHTHLANQKASVIDQATHAQQHFEALSADAVSAAQQAQAADIAATSTQAAALAQQAAAQKQTQDLSTALAAARLTQQQNLAVLAGLSGGYGVQSLTPQEQATYAQQAAQASAQPVTAKAKTWTAAMGQSAAYRALSQLLTPYSFGGGNAAGATLGINSTGGGEHDGSIKGFDCSGLALFAWAPYAHFAHDAATQYLTVGKLHPTPDQLLPGDLVFWSSDTTAAGIHHVAIYLGAGLVVQAPQSGDVVRITPLASVSSGLFGATRPLS